MDQCRTVASESSTGGLDNLENSLYICNTAFANCDLHCGQISYKIIKYFPTNAHNRLVATYNFLTILKGFGSYHCHLIGVDYLERR